MQFVTCADFLERRQLTLPDGKFVAVGIAASSEVDLVTINGHVLGPQALVPYGTTCEAVRGRRNEPVAQLAGTIGQKLVIQLYERCDVLVPPGPRAPIVVSSGVRVLSNTLAGQEPLLRVPFSGRKQCQFAIQFETTSGAYNARVRGVRYQTGEYQKLKNNFDTHAYVVDDADVPLVITASGPDGDIQATVFYVGGGGDLQEAFDELELYVYGIAEGPFESVHAMAEASGERG